MRKKQTFLALALLFATTSIFCQYHSNLGIDITNEFTSTGYIRSGIGITFDKQMMKYSGLETGVFFRTYKEDYSATNTPYPISFTLIERHLSIPLAYKFYSRFLNFSVGPSIDWYIGWRTKNHSPSSIVVNYHGIDPRFIFGIIGKVGKNINIGEKILLEPEVRFNHLFGLSRDYIGVGLLLKYKIGEL